MTASVDEPGMTDQPEARDFAAEVAADRILALENRMEVIEARDVQRTDWVGWVIVALVSGALGGGLASAFL